MRSSAPRGLPVAVAICVAVGSLACTTAQLEEELALGDVRPIAVARDYDFQFAVSPAVLRQKFEWVLHSWQRTSSWQVEVVPLPADAPALTWHETYGESKPACLNLPEGWEHIELAVGSAYFRERDGGTALLVRYIYYEGGESPRHRFSTGTCEREIKQILDRVLAG